MTRAQLEHIIRAASKIANEDELVIIGSQAILGQFPEAPPELRESMEADVYPRNRPELAELIEGSIGELSMFHESFGYYAQGVGKETATLPDGWADRLIPIRNENTSGATGWCLEINDLLLSKVVAWREKDRDFVIAALRHRLGSVEVMKQRLPQLPVSEELRPHVEQRLAMLSKL